MSRRQRERRLLQVAAASGFAASIVMAVAAIAVSGRAVEPAFKGEPVINKANLPVSPEPMVGLLFPELESAVLPAQPQETGSLDVLIQNGPEISQKVSQAVEAAKDQTAVRIASRSM